ncbi:MAG: APC family permease [Limnobacter sp.]|nr:APC family permease [Limnobacter sp.]
MSENVKAPSSKRGENQAAQSRVQAKVSAGVFSEDYAWVAVGACGLASIAFGPEAAFMALGGQNHLLIFLGLLTAVCILLVSLTYFRVSELFPKGGGGYSMATQLLGPYVGVVAGAALLVDYVLMVAMGISAASHLVFTFLPSDLYDLRFWLAMALMVALLLFHMQGRSLYLKPFKWLFTVFLGAHLVFILVALSDHFQDIGGIVERSVQGTQGHIEMAGLLAVIAVFAKGFFLGGGTYTGIEAASDCIQLSRYRQSAERRRKLLVYVACALAFAAAGFSVLYLLWGVTPEPARALNAVLFETVFAQFGWHPTFVQLGAISLIGLEVAILLLASHVAFRVGPRVISTMAIDSWLPHQFRYLSDRLVVKNGIVLMGVLALVAIYLSGADIRLLLVLFSINVFIVFSLSMAGLVVYWVKHRKDVGALRGLCSALLGFSVSTAILLGTIVTQFSEGGWFTVLITSGVVGACVWIRAHYRSTRKRISVIDEEFANTPYGSEQTPTELDPEGNTAVFVVGNSRGGGMHAFLWVQRMFPGHFKNFIFINARTVDAQAYGGREAMEAMRTDASVSLNFFVNFCRSHGLRARSHLGFGTDAVESLTGLAKDIGQEFPNAIFFTSKLVFEEENAMTRLLHNQAALELQRRLHNAGQQMVILPMRV